MLLVGIIFIVTAFFYAGILQGWLWQMLILGLFVFSWADLAPAIGRYIRPWIFLGIFLLYGAGQAGSGFNPGLDGAGYGSYYFWETWCRILYMGYFLLFGISCGVIVNSRKFWQGFLPFLAIFMFILLFLALVQGLSLNDPILWKSLFPKKGLLGPFFNRNNFGAFVIQIFPLISGYLYWKWLSWERSGGFTGQDLTFRERSVSFLRSGIPFLCLLLAFMFFMILLAMGKWGFMVLSAGLVVYLSFIFKHRVRFPLIMVGSIGLLYAVLGPLLGKNFWVTKFFNSLEGAISSRLITFTTTLDFWQNNPLFGAGLGTYYYISKKFIPLDGLAWKYAHNDYIELLFESGILGTALLFLMAVVCIRQGIVNFKRHQDLFWKIMVLQAMVSLGLFAILEITDFHLKTPLNAMVMILQISILFIPPQEEKEAVLHGSGRISRVSLFVFLSLSVAVVFLLGDFSYAQRRYEILTYTDSVEALEEGVRAFPQSAELWSSLADRYRRQADSLQGEYRREIYEKAIQCLERAVQIVPSFSFYWQDLAELQIKTGQDKKALESIRQAQYWAPYSKKTVELIKQLKGGGS